MIMYDVSPIKNNDYVDCYVYKSKNDKGQRICVEIFRSKYEALWITFYITTKKRNGFQEDEITGKDGVKSLLWAKKCVLDFIERYGTRFKGCKLCIHATDERRFNVYKRYLQSCGFREVLNGKRILMIEL